MTFEERFWQMVDKNGPVVRPELGPCWLWIGATMRDGRGKIRMSNPRRLESAPRAAFFVANGRCPDNFACHKCDYPPCVNPAHLFDGTPAQNTADAMAKGRMDLTTRRRGDDHPTRVLCSADIPVIIARRRAGEFLREIADDYGVNYQTISAVVKGRTWRSVTNAL